MNPEPMTFEALEDAIEGGETEFLAKRFEHITFPATLTDVLFKHCEFIACTFSSGTLRNTRFEHCQFYEEATTQGCAFRYCDLSHASFTQCDLRHCDFSQSNWYDLTISDCRGLGLNGRGVSNQKQVNEHVSLQSLTVRNTDLTLSDFAHADLGDSTLYECRCTEVDWTEANLCGSRIIQCDLTGGQFDRALIEEVDLSESLFNSIDVRHVSLQGVRVTSDQLPFLMSGLGLVITDQ
jgi:fluoroquinolone resistance protein